MGAEIPPKFRTDFQYAQQQQQYFHSTGDLNSLNAAIITWERILNHPDFLYCDQDFRLGIWNNASVAYLLSYWSTGQISNLNQALQLLQHAVDATPEDHPELRIYLNNLGNGLSDRYNRTGRLEDLDEAIRLHRQAAEITPTGHIDLHTYLNNLANGLSDRYERIGQLDDLEEAIHIYGQAVSTTTLGHPDLPSIFNNLGTGLLARYERTGQMEDLEEAIRVCRQAVDATPADHPDLPSRLNNLGTGLLARYECTGQMEDLEEAIRVYRQSVGAIPTGHIDLSSALNNLGAGLSNRYSRIGRLEDMEEAIRVYRQAVEAKPTGHPGLRIYLNNLGTGLRTRYSRMGRLEDLEEAIRVYRQAVGATPAAHPNLRIYLNNLGNGLSDRYELIGHLEDLEESIRVHRQAVEITPTSHIDLHIYLNNLGNGLSSRYGRMGRLEDLEEATHVYLQAVAITPAGHPDLHLYLNNLGNGLSDYYGRTRRLEDLEEVISIYRQMVDATPADHPNLPSRLNNLGNGLSNRYSRIGRLEDMEEAIRVYRRAVGTTPTGHPELRIYLNNLGNGLSDRYKLTRGLEDLEESIRIHRQAVEITPIGHTNLYIYLNNLANGLRSIYRHTGQLGNLEEAILINRQVVETLSVDHPDMPGYLNNLGNGLWMRYGQIGLLKDLEDAIRVYRQACQLGLGVAIGESILAGRNWLNWAFERQAWQEIVEARGYLQIATQYRLAIQFSRQDKNFALEDMHDLSTCAAYAYIQLDQPQSAVEAIEQGRAQLLREALERNRRDLARLPDFGFGDLYERYIRASALYDELLSQSGSKHRPPDWVKQIQDALQEMQSTANVIRQQAGEQHPEYRFFLRSLSFEEIRQQAHDAPLVYFFATSLGGMALIVHFQGMPQIIKLPGLTKEILREKVQHYIQSYAVREDWFTVANETLGWLGEAVMAPVLNSLDGAKQAVLIPSGLLGLLPLHAAILPPYQVENPKYALDFCTFTYVPSAQALYHARLVANHPANALLLVDNPDSSLTFTEAEVQAVLAHFPQAIHLPRKKATKDSVRRAIPSANILHFSTHGLAGWSEAEQSRMKLADGDLTLGELFDLHLENARLAVLSACETGLLGTKLPDEVVSLPCGWMQAGVPGVIGSLWSVSDFSTAILMARFYDFWQNKDLPLPEALCQAQIWLRGSTTEDLKRTFKGFIETPGVHMSNQSAKALYAHIGWENPGAHPFAHPFYWAAFSYTGL